MAATRIVLTSQQREELRAAAESPSTSTRMATRARIILALEHHWKIKDVAEALEVSTPTVALWKKRFLEDGVPGLSDRHETTGSDAELQRLLDAAERTVSKRGFCATRVSDIAFEAGVSSSLLMYYFDSRQETLVRAMLHANQRAATQFEEKLVRGGQSARERLSAFIERVMPEAGSRLDEYLLELDLLAHARQYPEFLSIWDEHQRRWIAGLTTIIADGVADGSFSAPAIPPAELAQNVLAMIDGFGYQIAVGSSLVSPAAMSSAVTGYLATHLG